MKKVLPVLIIVIVAGTLLYYLTQKESEQEGPDAITTTRIVQISEDPVEMLSFINEIQKEPSQVMQTFNILRKLIYNSSFDDEPLDEPALERLVNMQRLLYHDEILNKNQKDLHFAQIQSDIQKWAEAELKLYGADMLPPVYYGDKNEICLIKVVYYTNTPTEESNLFVAYELIRNEFDLWQIIAWDEIAPFEVVK